MERKQPFSLFAAQDPTRRQFVRTAGVFGAGVALGADATQLAQDSGSPNSGEIPNRSLGRTGLQVSALAVGGHHLGDIQDPGEAIQLVHEAIDAGVNFFDNC